MSEFLDMQGYGVFIWSAYGVAFVLLSGLVFMTLRRRKILQRELGDKHD